MTTERIAVSYAVATNRQAHMSTTYRFFRASCKAKRSTLTSLMRRAAEIPTDALMLLAIVVGARRVDSNNVCGRAG